MLTLVGKLKVLKVNIKPSVSSLKGVKEGDIITVTFDVNGNGGNSPKVDVHINGTYTGSPFARAFNETVFEDKQKWSKDGYINLGRQLEVVKI